MLLFSLFCFACNSTPDSPAPKENEPPPIHEFSNNSQIKPKLLTNENVENYLITLPKRSNSKIYIAKLNTRQKDTSIFLKKIIEQHAMSGDDPWAMAHAMLALGVNATTPSGVNVVDAIFSYAEISNISKSPFPSFPKFVTRKNVEIPVEPHTHLMLKVFTELAVPPDQPISVNNISFTMADYYRGTILSSHLNPQSNVSSYESPNDMAWSVQGLLSLMNPNQDWRAANGQTMSSNFLGQFITAVIAQESNSLKQAMAAQANFKKDDNGIFKYTCGGAHLLQSVAYANARGFGNEKTLEEVQSQIDLLFYRFPRELQIYDDIMKAQPQHKVRLLAQRLKFVGHFLESAQKLSMMGLYTPNEDQIKMMQGALDQLVLVVAALDQEGIYNSLYNLKVNDPQLYRDILGDTAHALYGIYLFSGTRKITY